MQRQAPNPFEGHPIHSETRLEVRAENVLARLNLYREDIQKIRNDERVSYCMGDIREAANVIRLLLKEINNG